MAPLSIETDHEALCAKVWAVLKEESPEVGDGGRGEFWADFSSMLTTRYLVCNVEPDGQGSSIIRMRAGRKPGYVADVVAALAVLAIVWAAGKLFFAVTWPYVLTIVCCLLLLALVAVDYGKSFGAKEAARILTKICSTK